MPPDHRGSDVTFKLTNSLAREDFITAYATDWGCEREYAARLLDELLDQRAYQEAEKLRGLDASLNGFSIDPAITDLLADHIDPTKD